MVKWYGLRNANGISWIQFIFFSLAHTFHLLKVFHFSFLFPPGPWPPILLLFSYNGNCSAQSKDCEAGWQRPFYPIPAPGGRPENRLYGAKINPSPVNPPHLAQRLWWSLATAVPINNAFRPKAKSHKYLTCTCGLGSWKCTTLLWVTYLSYIWHPRTKPQLANTDPSALPSYHDPWLLRLNAFLNIESHIFLKNIWKGSISLKKLA